MEQNPPQHAWSVVILRGLKKRCPCCGRGKMFASFFRLRPHCLECGWIFEREPGAMTGGMYLVSIVTQIFALLVLVALHFVSWSFPAQLIGGGSVIAVFSLGFFPYSKSLWAAVSFRTDLLSRDAFEPGFFRSAFAPLSESKLQKQIQKSLTVRGR